MAKKGELGFEVARGKWLFAGNSCGCRYGGGEGFVILSLVMPICRFGEVGKAKRGIVKLRSEKVLWFCARQRCLLVRDGRGVIYLVVHGGII
jgi:hypothetical protein